jgi:hypothetical protein
LIISLNETCYALSLVDGGLNGGFVVAMLVKGSKRASYSRKALIRGNNTEESRTTAMGNRSGLVPAHIQPVYIFLTGSVSVQSHRNISELSPHETRLI